MDNGQVEVLRIETLLKERQVFQPRNQLTKCKETTMAKRESEIPVSRTEQRKILPNQQDLHYFELSKTICAGFGSDHVRRKFAPREEM